jgi:hypothetical protein
MRRPALALIILGLAALTSSDAGDKNRTLTILYTASAQGQVRSCNCTKFRSGGYGRELTLLKAIRRDCPDSLLIEGGDLVAWTGFAARFKTELAVRAMKLLDYQAIVPGENEIGRPGDRSIDSFDPEPAPIVCANYLDPSGAGRRCVPYVLLKTKSGLRVGLIGLLSKSAGRIFQEQDFKDSVQDPSPVLTRLVHEVRPKCDFLAVVYHGPVAEAEKLASVKGVNLVLATHRSGREVLLPVKPSNEVEPPVKMVGGVPVVGAETHENWSLGRIDIDLDGSGGIASAKHKLFYLDRRYPEDRALVTIYDEYSRKVKEAVLSFSKEFESKAETMLAKRGLNLVEMRKRLHKSPLATADRCKTCHSSIHESWSTSRHAHAMATLEKTQQDFDPECVTCHATGVLVRNGFANKRDTPELANVQCEACHGPGLAHADSPSKGYGKVEEQTCRSCHTDERTPDFDFEKAWGQIKHPQETTP